MTGTSDLQALAARDWDVIVIGTGIGGGMVGRRLAEAGLSVLFVEKGPAGFRSEENPLAPDTLTDPVARLLRGSWPDPVRAVVGGQERTVFAPLGAGVGGSSVFYAATLERPEPHDLEDSPEKPHPTGGWPVSYAGMLPYFDQAQALLAVRGEPDPLAQHPSPQLGAAPPLAIGDARLMAAMRAAGLHPYQLHSALRGLPGCQSCLGRKCPRDCKMDGRSAGVLPALATGHAALIDRCTVRALQGSAGRITTVLAERDGQALALRARRIVLAAGALSSPRLLLQSRAPHWPAGIGNDRDQVGRNLMFHLNEIFALWPARRDAFAAAAKAVGFRDLYFAEGQRLGMVQAMGLNVGAPEILGHLRQRLARSPLRHVPGLSDLARLPALVAARLLGQAKVFVGLLEDLPYPGNRVAPDPDHPDGIRITYRLAPELLARRRLFRRLIRVALKRQRLLFLTHAPEPNLGHPCGTLRMGRDPADSVTDADCRVHGLTNLWVADASVMPTAMGVNPSLTIAALALRVGDAVLADLRTEGRMP